MVGCEGDEEAYQTTLRSHVTVSKIWDTGYYRQVMH